MGSVAGDVEDHRRKGRDESSRRLSMRPILLPAVQCCARVGRDNRRRRKSCPIRIKNGGKVMKEKAGSFHLGIGLNFVMASLSTMKDREIPKFFPAEGGHKTTRQDVIDLVQGFRAKGLKFWPLSECSRQGPEGNCLGHGPMFEKLESEVKPNGDRT